MNTLSLCVIAKDEESLLPRLLRSAAPHVDEIVVVDTGSSDRTAEVARKLGAKVLSVPFDDDFSAVRNASLDHATMDWVLVLDADEQLAPGAGAAIRRAIEDRRVCGFYLPFENDLGAGRVHRCGLLRLFRRDRAVRFEFCLHEQVLPSLVRLARRRGMKLAPLPGATVLHDGYLAQRVAEKDKDARNLRLYRKQVERHPDHAYTWYKFGDFLRRFEDRRDEAVAALERARGLIDAMPPAEVKDLSFATEVFALLALERDKRGDSAGALAIASEGLARHGESPNLLYVLGHAQSKAGDARAAFRTYARLRLQDRKMHAVPPEPGVTGPHACFGMGRSLLLLGHPVAALANLGRSLELDPTKVEPRVLRARVRLERGDVLGAASDYATALEHDPSNGGVRLKLGQLLLHCGDFAGARAQLERAHRDGADARVVAPRLGQALLALGELEGALGAFGSAPEEPDARIGLRILTQLADGADPLTDPAIRGRSPWPRLLASSPASRAPAR